MSAKASVSSDCVIASKAELATKSALVAISFASSAV